MKNAVHVSNQRNDVDEVAIMIQNNTSTICLHNKTVVLCIVPAYQAMTSYEQS